MKLSAFLNPFRKLAFCDECGLHRSSVLSTTRPDGDLMLTLAACPNCGSSVARVWSVRRPGLFRFGWVDRDGVKRP